MLGYGFFITMDKDSIYELQKIDCNCNDCAYMVRDLERFKSFDYLHTDKTGKKQNGSSRIHYGHCNKFNKPVNFMPNTCQVDTQQCFKHRKDK
jgi:hypothetical protein